MNKVEQGFQALDHLRGLNKSLDKKTLYDQIERALGELVIECKYYELEINDYGDTDMIYYVNWTRVSEEEWYQTMALFDRLGIPYKRNNVWHNLKEAANG